MHKLCVCACVCLCLCVFVCVCACVCLCVGVMHRNRCLSMKYKELSIDKLSYFTKAIIKNYT